MELPPELRKLVEDIIDLISMDEARKKDMKQDPDSYLVSLLLHFKAAMMSPQYYSGSLYDSYAAAAISYRTLLKAQEIVGKKDTAMVLFLEPFSKPYNERQTQYCRHKKKKKRA